MADWQRVWFQTTRLSVRSSVMDIFFGSHSSLAFAPFLPRGRLPRAICLLCNTRCRFLASLPLLTKPTPLNRLEVHPSAASPRNWANFFLKNNISRTVSQVLPPPLEAMHARPRRTQAEHGGFPPSPQDDSDTKLKTGRRDQRKRLLCSVTGLNC